MEPMFKWSSVTLAFLALSWFMAPSIAARQEPPSTRWVDIGKPHLAKRGDKFFLVHTVSSTASRDLSWALVEVNDADGARVCEWLKRLDPRQKYRFECPLAGAAAGQKYSSRLRVYSDDKLEDRDIFYESTLQLTTQELAAAGEIGAASESTAVPLDVVEAAEAVLPVTFKPTWYRRLDRGFSMRAYENSGDLTVTSDEVVFADGKKTVRIPYARIASVRWEPVPADIANHWVVVRFTNEDGKPDGVGFRDGGRLGTRQGTGKIYVAVRRATRK